MDAKKLLLLANIFRSVRRSREEGHVTQKETKDEKTRQKEKTENDAPHLKQALSGHGEKSERERGKSSKMLFSQREKKKKKAECLKTIRSAKAGTRREPDGDA